jgi:hypothetical protein
MIEMALFLFAERDDTAESSQSENRLYARACYILARNDREACGLRYERGSVEFFPRHSVRARTANQNSSRNFPETWKAHCRSSRPARTQNPHRCSSSGQSHSPAIWPAAHHHNQENRRNAGGDKHYVSRVALFRPQGGSDSPERRANCASRPFDARKRGDLPGGKWGRA